MRKVLNASDNGYIEGTDLTPGAVTLAEVVPG